MSELLTVAAVTIDRDDAIIVLCICAAIAAVCIALYYARRA